MLSKIAEDTRRDVSCAVAHHKSIPDLWISPNRSLQQLALQRGENQLCL
jgi:hypothetical protein